MPTLLVPVLPLHKDVRQPEAHQHHKQVPDQSQHRLAYGAGPSTRQAGGRDRLDVLGERLMTAEVGLTPGSYTEEDTGDDAGLYAIIVRTVSREGVD